MRVQRLLWASTSAKDLNAPDMFYVHGLSAPLTVDTIPDTALRAFFKPGEVAEEMPPDGGDCDAVLEEFVGAGVDARVLATRLQDEGVEAFVASWKDVLRAPR